MLKILILADRPGWIVDRIVDRMIEGIPCEFTKRHYFRGVGSEEFLRLSKQHDLVHYTNSDIKYHLSVLDEILENVPFLYSIRSHRYSRLTRGIVAKATRVHVVNPLLLKDFPEAVYIPDGIFECFRPRRKFVVGWAGLSSSYKGYHLIEQACRELDVEFRPAKGEIVPEKMSDYYASLNLYVCASQAEGFSTPVMECLAMNVPVITTDVGVPSTLNVVKVERTVEGIKRGIRKFYTTTQVLPEFSWDRVNAQFYELYQRTVDVLSP